MAVGKIDANTYFLSIDPAGSTGYDLVKCLEDFEFSRSTNVVDAGSMCGPDKRPGAIDGGTISLNGQSYIDADAATVSNVDLDTLHAASTQFTWKISKTTPTTGDPVYTGTGFLSDLKESFSHNEVGKFSATIQVVGTYTKTVTS